MKFISVQFSRIEQTALSRLLWLTCDHFVGKASAMVNQPGQLSLLPSVGRGMSSISVVRWVTPLAAVSPYSECLYEGKADVVYLQVTLCDPHLSA